MPISTLNKNSEKKLFGAAVVAACGLWLLYLSGLYKTNGGGVRLSLFMFPQILVFLIFGAFQAFNFSKLSDPIYEENMLCSAIRLIGNTFVYTAFYTIVLFPLSGFGILEWLLVAFIIFSDFFTKFIPKKTLSIGQSPLHVLVFGLILFLAKITVFYIFPNNIYNTAFVGNGTARFLLAILTIGAIGMLFAQLKKHHFPKRTANENEEHTLSKKLVSAIQKFGLFLKNTILALFSLPVLLIMLLFVFVLFLGASFFIGYTILSDTLALIEPVLEKMMKTGENIIPITHYYTIMQITAFFFMLLYQIIAYKHLKDTASVRVATLYNELAQQYPVLPEEVQELLEKDRESSLLLIAAYPSRYRHLFIKRYKKELSAAAQSAPGHPAREITHEAFSQALSSDTAALLPESAAEPQPEERS